MSAQGVDERAINVYYDDDEDEDEDELASSYARNLGAFNDEINLKCVAST